MGTNGHSKSDRIHQMSPLTPGSLQQPGSQEGARLRIYFLGLSSLSRSKRRHIDAPVCLEEGQGKQQVAGMGVGGREASDQESIFPEDF